MSRTAALVEICGGTDSITEGLLSSIQRFAIGLPCLVNIDRGGQQIAVCKRCIEFADGITPGTEALIVTVLYAPPRGLDYLAVHAGNAALWAFTQQAALEWAPRRIRVNAIGLGVSPAGPFDAQEQAGRASAAIPAHPASLDDIARTIGAMAAWPSMTGQIVRLGESPPATGGESRPATNGESRPATNGESRPATIVEIRPVASGEQAGP